MTMAEEPELEEYEELEEEQPVGDDAAANKGFVGIHSVSFDDMQLKRELLRAIQDAGFEHPSESAVPFFTCACVVTVYLVLSTVHVARSRRAFVDSLVSCVQFSSNASPSRFRARMSLVRQSLAWGKLRFSCWAFCISWKCSLARSPASL